MLRLVLVQPVNVNEELGESKFRITMFPQEFLKVDPSPGQDLDLNVKLVEHMTQIGKPLFIDAALRAVVGAEFVVGIEVFVLRLVLVLPVDVNEEFRESKLRVTMFPQKCLKVDPSPGHKYLYSDDSESRSAFSSSSD